MKRMLALLILVTLIALPSLALAQAANIIRLSPSGDYTYAPTHGWAQVLVSNCSATCALTLGETGARSGMRLTVVNVSASDLTIADTSGVSETAGTMTLGQYDSISYVYADDRWVETGRSNN